MKIPQNIIDDIKDLSIVDIISNDVKLTKKGVRHTGCCPFHNEKTPSFMVNEAGGYYKCFGCGAGGDIITYVMEHEKLTYVEALEKLAKDNNILFEKTESTPEEVKLAEKKESIRIANQAANLFFTEQIKLHPEAMAYALGRWSEQTIQELEIGYAPGKSATLNHLTKKQFSQQVLLDAGLINKNKDTGSFYDTFNARITIPIRSKNNVIIGFTCRIIAGDSPAKFLNTAETEVFKKGSNLFGYSHARKESAKQDQIILVEGAPDVIRLNQIGIINAVAPLGTALTEEQIHLLQRATNSVLMIPDTDKAGVNAAKKNGKALIAAGAVVRVMSLQGGKDADEVLLSEEVYKKHLEENTEQFVLWYADNVLKSCKDELSKLTAIQDVCDLIALCPLTSSREFYLESLIKVHKSAKTWKSSLSESLKAVNAAKKKEEKKQEALKEQQEKEEDENKPEKVTYEIKNNCYYGTTQKGVYLKWSNFIIEPLAHIKSKDNAKRLFTIKNYKGEEEIIEMKQEDLVSLQKFKVKTESLGNFLWEAEQSELHQVKKNIYDQTISCEEIVQLGWQKRNGFFAWGNGAVVDGEFVPVDNLGMLEAKGRHYYLPAFSKIYEHDYAYFQFERQFKFTKDNGISLHDYAYKYVDVFGDNAKICLCYLLAVIFKDVVFRKTSSFPILNIFGPKGTGKTEAGRAIAAFFAPDVKPVNLTTATIPALSDAVARVSNAIVHIDEYKNDIEIAKREFLKSIWDCAGRSRMNMEKDKKTETLAVDSGVVLTGQEMATADIALFSRTIFLTCYKSEFTIEEKNKFIDLTNISSLGLSHLVNEILRHRAKVEQEYPLKYVETTNEMARELAGQSIEDRTLKNWVSVIAMYKTLESSINLPFTFTDVFQVAKREIQEQNFKTKESNELSAFWECVESMVRSVNVVFNVDYKFKTFSKKLTLREYPNGIELPEDRTYLLIQFNNIATQYQKDSKKTGAKTLPKDTLKNYLIHSKEFVGTKNSERFGVLIAEGSSITKGDNNVDLSSMTSPKKYSAEVNKSCFVFDYDMIQKNYNISINEVFGPDEEDKSASQEPVKLDAKQTELSI